MISGNAVALALCGLQYFTGIIPLDAENYFMSSVPIAFPWFAIAAVNIGALFIFIVILVFSLFVYYWKGMIYSSTEIYNLIFILSNRPDWLDCLN